MTSNRTSRLPAHRLSVVFLIITGFAFAPNLAFAQGTSSSKGGRPTLGIPAAAGKGGVQSDPGASDPSMEPNRPLYVTGQVVMSNGEPLPERVVIERVCSLSDAHKEGFSDAEGRFSLQLGMNRGIVSDSSANIYNNLAGNPKNAPTDTRFWNCELRANLPGYISSSVTLAGRRYFDPPDVGYIILRPFGETEGLSESATTDLAPADSRKAFNKGMEALEKSDLKAAESHFRNAVALFDRHAEAWYQLGKIYRRNDSPTEARAAFVKATEADSNYVLPYEQLYQLAFERDDMPDLLQQTETLLRLNPYEYPLAYYYSAVANLQLKHYEAGEKRIRAAIEMDPQFEQPMHFFVLSFLLMGEGKLTEALGAFDIFLTLNPEGHSVREARTARNKLKKRIDGKPILMPAKRWSLPYRPTAAPSP